MHDANYACVRSGGRSKLLGAAGQARHIQSDPWQESPNSSALALRARPSHKRQSQTTGRGGALGSSSKLNPQVQLRTEPSGPDNKALRWQTCKNSSRKQAAGRLCLPASPGLQSGTAIRRAGSHQAVVFMHLKPLHDPCLAAFASGEGVALPPLSGRGLAPL